MSREYEVVPGAHKPVRDGLRGDGLRALNNCSWRATSTPLFNYLVRWTRPGMGRDQKAIMARQITTREKAPCINLHRRAF